MSGKTKQKAAPKAAMKSSKSPAKKADVKGSAIKSLKKMLGLKETAKPAAKGADRATGAAKGASNVKKTPATKAPLKTSGKTKLPSMAKVAGGKPAAKGAAKPAAAPAKAGKGVVTKAAVVTKGAAPAKGAAAAKAAIPVPPPAKGKGKGKAKESSLADAILASRSKKGEGGTVCREVACELMATTGGYCRMHYIKNWKKIKRKEMILKEKKLNHYIEELVSKYPDKYIEAIRQDLASEKDFAKVIQDLEIEEGGDDFESVETESAEGIIDNIKRDFEDEGDVF